MGDLLSAALAYAERGWPVFPCQSQGDRRKQPFTLNGFKDASTDPDQIRYWWGRWPDAAIGVATGAASGLVVIDIDRKNGVDGFATLAAMPEPLPPSLVSVTPTGGEHHFYAHADGMGCRTGFPGPGVDVRGDGGYVIVPPSLLDVGAYAWKS